MLDCSSIYLPLPVQLCCAYYNKYYNQQLTTFLRLNIHNHRDKMDSCNVTTPQQTTRRELFKLTEDVSLKTFHWHSALQSIFYTRNFRSNSKVFSTISAAHVTYIILVYNISTQQVTSTTTFNINFSRSHVCRILIHQKSILIQLHLHILIFYFIQNCCLAVKYTVGDMISKLRLFDYILIHTNR